MKPSKTADSKVDWSMWTQWTLALMKKVVVVGPTHLSTNNNHSNRWGKNRNGRVIWFNLPFCKLTNINIGKYFLNPLDRHFNQNNPLGKFFNRNTVKISYSCTNNMHSILNNYNRRLLDKLNRNSGGLDKVFNNCRRRGECPLGGQYNSKNIIYQACISPMEHNNDGERV